MAVVGNEVGKRRVGGERPQHVDRSPTASSIPESNACTSAGRRAVHELQLVPRLCGDRADPVDEAFLAAGDEDGQQRAGLRVRARRSRVAGRTTRDTRAPTSGSWRLRATDSPKLSTSLSIESNAFPVVVPCTSSNERRTVFTVSSRSLTAPRSCADAPASMNPGSAARKSAMAASVRDRAAAIGADEECPSETYHVVATDSFWSERDSSSSDRNGDTRVPYCSCARNAENRSLRPAAANDDQSQERHEEDEEELRPEAQLLEHSRVVGSPLAALELQPNFRGIPGNQTAESHRVVERLELLDRHEDGPGLRALRRAHHAPPLEEVHEPAGPGEAHPELALQHARRAEAAADHELHRLGQQVVVVVGVAARPARRPAGVSSATPST